MTTLSKRIRRVTQSKLDGHHGRDRNRRIVITLIPGNGHDVPDLLELRPERTRRAECIAVVDAYTYALKCRANKALMERLRERKAKKQAAREAARSRRIIRGGSRET